MAKMLANFKSSTSPEEAKKLIGFVKSQGQEN